MILFLASDAYWRRWSHVLDRKTTAARDILYWRGFVSHPSGPVSYHTHMNMDRILVQHFPGADSGMTSCKANTPLPRSGTERPGFLHCLLPEAPLIQRSGILLTFIGTDV